MESVCWLNICPWNDLWNVWIHKLRSRRTSALKGQLTTKCHGVGTGPLAAPEPQLSSPGCFPAILIGAATPSHLGQHLFFCPLQHWLMPAQGFALPVPLHWQPLIQVHPHRQNLHLPQQKMGQMKGKGLIYFFNGILVLLNAYPDIGVLPFRPLSVHLGTEDTAQSPVNFSWMYELLRTKDLLPEISPALEETSFSGNLKKYSCHINTA